ncbi:MAG TPA: M50 family metallopeptidase [Bacillota bacterium]|nr:M50 family metallopeptidase [Bacillota bacterium]
MTARKSLPPIHLHPILMLFIAIAFLTGTFVELLIIFCIVLFHELGHYSMALLFKWRIQGIVLWIFGGVMETDEYGNRPLYEELLVTIAGPFQHIVLYLILFLGMLLNFLPSSILEMALYYNSLILFFNLIPIWPLDGGKFLFLLLSYWLPYKTAHQTIILLSIFLSFILACVFLFFMPFSLSAFCIALFLAAENRVEWKRRYYVFIRFLLERYQNGNVVKVVDPIVISHHASLMDVFAQFRREKKHAIYVTYPGNRRKTMDENDCLYCFFQKRRYDLTIGDIADEIA